jgi:hypothetical protein
VTYKARLLTLIAATVVITGLIGSSIASAQETPGWDVGPQRLQEGQEEEAVVTPASGTFLSIVGSIRIGSRLFSLRIRSTPVVSSPAILGSCWRCDGKSNETVTFESPEVLTEEQGETKFTAQPGCETSVESKPLAAKMWLEGSKAGNSSKVDVVYNEKTFEESRSKIAKITIIKKGGSSCNIIEKEIGTEKEKEIEKKFTLEGDFAAKIGPENEEESKKDTFNFPEKPVNRVWQPPGNQTGEETVGLSLAGQTASIIGEQVAELKSGAKFGDIVENKFNTEGTRWLIDDDTLTETFPVEGSDGTSRLESQVIGVKIAIECTKNTLAEASIGALGVSEGEIAYNECGKVKEVKGKEEKALNCEVTTPIRLKVTDLVIGKGLEDEFKPATPPIFAEIEVKGSACVLKGKYKLEGTYAASLPEGTVAKKEHEVTFTSAGSKLTLGKEPATLTNTIKVTM